jgi:hypothetical protein
MRRSAAQCGMQQMGVELCFDSERRENATSRFIAVFDMKFSVLLRPTVSGTSVTNSKNK